MVAEAPQVLGQVVAIREDGATLRRRHGLGRVQGQHREIGDGSHGAPIERRPERVGGIRDDGQGRIRRAVRDRLQRPVVGRVAGVVDRDDRPGRGADGAGDRVRVDEQIVRADIGEDRCRARVQDGVRGRDEGHGRGDGLVARAQAGHDGSAVQRRRPGAKGHGVSSPGRRLERPLELRHARTRRQPVRTERRGDRCDVGVVDDLAGVRQERGSDRGAAVDRQAQRGSRSHQRTVAPVASCDDIQSRTRPRPPGRSTSGRQPRVAAARRGSQRRTAISLCGWMWGTCTMRAGSGSMSAASSFTLTSWPGPALRIRPVAASARRGRGHEPRAVLHVQQRRLSAWHRRRGRVAPDPAGCPGEDGHDPAFTDGALVRTVGVERPDDRRGQPVGVEVGHRERLARQLRRCVGRGGLRCVVLVDAGIARPVVHHARAHEQNARPDSARGLEHVERSDDIVLERRPGVVDRLLHRDRRREVRDRVDPARPATARGGVADVPFLERAQPRVIAELVQGRDVASDEVVDGQDLVAPRQQLTDDPAADEPGRAGDEDPHRSPVRHAPTT